MRASGLLLNNNRLKAKYLGSANLFTSYSNKLELKQIPLL